MNNKQKYSDTNLSEKTRVLCGAEKNGYVCTRTIEHTDKHEAGIGGHKAVSRWRDTSIDASRESLTTFDKQLALER